jgi:hypothetical protein
LSPRRFGLREYYLLEGLNAFGTNVFFLGVFFHARVNHGFSDTANLMLAATQGAAYIATTRIGGRLADRIGADRSIALGLAGMSLALIAGWQLPQAAGLFTAIALYSASTALTWPALEAAIARAPDRGALARRAGLYNVIWSLVGASGFFFSGALFALDPDTVFWAPLAAHVLQLAGLAARGDLRRPALPPGPAPSPGSAVTTDTEPAVEGWREFKARYLFAARVANGLGYFLFGAFGALAPTVGERLGLGTRLAIWLVSAYLFARGASFLLFWRWSGWEYRRGWLIASLVLQPVALAAAFAATSTAVVVCALAVLGVLSGVAYSASLHASLDREGGEGEGGGVHEWVIGIGVLLGPLAGAAGIRLLDGATGAGALVAALGAAVALAGLSPLRREQAAG